MRLLHIDTDGSFNLTEFFLEIPPYAILSHTWGEDHEEVTYRDIVERKGATKPGHTKLQFCARQAAQNDIRYVWVDTACIDKSSSAELSEAINSMYRWYQCAAVCYVYLSDVTHFAMRVRPRVIQSSRWFSRGWTLQELIAPESVQFFTVEETYIGDRASLQHDIVEATGIPKAVLQGRLDALKHCTIDQKLSWAKRRQTKREEDAVYCLMGLFDVNMPLLYGEGRMRAHRRLLSEIKQSDWHASDVGGHKTLDHTLDYILQVRINPSLWKISLTCASMLTLASPHVL
jgi:hypothetical protein